MPVIDMATLEKKGEFGSREWGQACADLSVKILEAADIPEDMECAFTEQYTHPPARLMPAGRDKAGYHIILRKGRQISGGDGVPDEALAIPGLHITARWAAICNQSSAFYGTEGGKRRTADEKKMYEALAKYVGRPNPLGHGGGPKVYWPAEFGGALMEGHEEGNGLHNIAAAMQMPSPEFADFPVTEMLVPDFDAMTEAQKQQFIKMLAIEM